jgi:hypothetical protein
MGETFRSCAGDGDAGSVASIAVIPGREEDVDPESRDALQIFHLASGPPLRGVPE